jgi:hypothetical protein
VCVRVVELLGQFAGPVDAHASDGRPPGGQRLS